MNQTNREVPGMKERPASGEPVLAEVGRPVILSLGVAGYRSVGRTLGFEPDRILRENGV
jgi:riboflavin synthase